jgi:hypothetical protein
MQNTSKNWCPSHGDCKLLLTSCPRNRRQIDTMWPCADAFAPNLRVINVITTEPYMPGTLLHRIDALHCGNRKSNGVIAETFGNYVRGS